MRREAFVLNEMSWWRAMPIGLSCLLHVGLVTGLILGQQWVSRVVALQPPVLPVQLVTLDVAEPPREPAPPAPPRRERTTPIRRPEPPRLREPAAARVEEPTPQPVTPAPPAEVAPAPGAVTATLPAISEPAPAPGPPAPAPSGPTVALPAQAPIVASKPSATTPDGVIRTARPQGGYQVRPAYPSAPRRLGIQGTTMLRVHVLADGRIGDVLVERSAGHPDLDQAATEAVRRWRFEPARHGDDAVAVWVLLPVEFRLTQ